MKIFVSGDIHGEPLAALGATHFPQGRHLTKEDVVILLGDFGVIWNNISSKVERYNLKWLSERPWTTVFVKGNHENHARLSSTEFPTKEMFGAPVKEIAPSVYMLESGNIYTIGGKSFLAIGGAMSTDKQHRVENLSWWRQELLSFEEQERIFAHEKKDVDFIVSHTCPVSIVYKLHREDRFDDPTSRILEEVKNTYTFKKWFFGHMHEDVVFEGLDGYFQCCYYDIIEIWDDSRIA